MRKPRVLSQEDAAAALGDAVSTAQRWAGDAEDKGRAADVLAAELAEMQARAGDDLLDDDDPEALTRLVSDLERRRTEQNLASQAAERAAERLVGAQRDVVWAQAATVRSRAAALHQVVASRSARTDQLLAELAGWEQVAFAVADTNASGIGAPFRPWTLTKRISERAVWLDNQADHLERVAASSAPDSVASLASAPLPEVIDVELAALPVDAGV